MKTSNSQIQMQSICSKALIRENVRYAGSGGVSENNRGQGFVPAFLDTDSGEVYRSRYPDGRPAPVHMLSGLPGNLFDRDGTGGESNAVKDSVLSGFVLGETFYTREAAAIALRSLH